MTIAAPSIAKVGSTTRQERIALAILLLASLLIRLPFTAPNIAAGDAENYAFGALTRNFVAHPPGYCGFVFAGWLVNQIVGNINTSFVIIAEIAALASVACVFYLARAMGLRWPLALAAAALHSGSVNLLMVSGTALPHTTEALFATLMALLSLRAIQTKGYAWALGATVTWATAGFFRPTCAFFLAPLWLLMVWHFRRPIGPFALLVLLGGSIYWAAQKTNSYLLEHSSFAVAVPGGMTFALQVYMPADHEYVNLGTAIKNSGGVMRPTYHMPAIETIAWVEDHLGVHVMPRVQDLPPASLGRAALLLLQQSLKLAWYLAIGAPLLPLALLLRLGGRRLVVPSRQNQVFLGFWVIPACLFFVFGHLGVPAYLQVFLSGLQILTVFLVLATPVSIAGRAVPATSALFRRRGWCLMIVPGLMLLFFLFGRPLPPTSTSRQLLNVIFFQNNGWAIRHNEIHYRVGLTTLPDDPAKPGLSAMRTDAQLLQRWQRIHFSPIPPFYASRGQPADTR